MTQYEIVPLVLKTLLIAVPSMFILQGLYFIYSGWSNADPNYAWEQHTKRLLRQGIGPSHLKRNPEWEKSSGCRAYFLAFYGMIMIVVGIGGILMFRSVLFGT